MKLISALKQKNRLATRIAQIQKILTRDNSWEIEHAPDTNFAALFDELSEKTAELISLKARIAKANVGIYAKIEEMAELKGSISFLKGLPVKKGVYKEGGKWGEPAVERTYQCHLSQEEVDVKVNELQERLYAVQDEVDEYNGSTSV